MTATRNYSVHIAGLPEHERLVFRLIFSVSQRTRGREHGYELCEHPRADIAITASGDPPFAPGLASIVVRDTPAEAAPCLLRPLIATRVLAALDRLVIQHRPTGSAPAQERTRPPPAALAGGRLQYQ